MQALWRTAYKLTKQFMHPDFKGPMRASVTIKGKLEKFKIDMPLITALCNPGLKERHWERMSDKVPKLSKLFVDLKNWHKRNEHGHSNNESTQREKRDLSVESGVEL